MHDLPYVHPHPYDVPQRAEVEMNPTRAGNDGIPLSGRHATERADVREDIRSAEEQIARGQEIGHEAAEQRLLARFRR